VQRISFFTLDTYDLCKEKCGKNIVKRNLSFRNTFLDIYILIDNVEIMIYNIL